MMPDTASSKNRIEKPFTSRILYGCVTVLCLVGLFAFMVLNFGFVNGSQFNPVSFAERDFSYVRLPPTNIHLFPVTYMNKGGVLTDFLTKNTTLSRIKQPKNPIWHVSDVYSGTHSQTGDAKILTNCLQEVDAEGVFFWAQWSEKHPEMAAVFWPMVSNVAQVEAYLIIPDLFEAAKAIQANARFEKDMKQRLVNLCGSLGDDYRTASELNRAVTLYSLAIDNDQDANSKYILDRNECLKALNDVVESAEQSPE